MTPDGVGGSVSGRNDRRPHFGGGKRRNITQHGCRRGKRSEQGKFQHLESS
jgi:hypothetical protein